MVVCLCHRVSDRDIARAAAAGGSFEALQVELGFGTTCGRCLECAHATFREHAGACSRECPHCHPEAETAAVVGA